MLKLEGRERAYDPYIAQLAMVRIAYNAGDEKGVFATMNRLMDMLQKETKGTGIPLWSAKEIFDFCGRMTPTKLHDALRHSPELAEGGFDYWDDDVIDLGKGT